MRGRWRDTDAEEIRTYLCIALPSHVDPTTSYVPVRLDKPPVRRSIALRQERGHSVSILYALGSGTPSGALE
ncbi:jg23104, partial [Pararge aegeria aegeria]